MEVFLRKLRNGTNLIAQQIWYEHSNELITETLSVPFIAIRIEAAVETSRTFQGISSALNRILVM